MKTCHTKPSIESPSRNKMLKLSAEHVEMKKISKDIKAIEFVPDGENFVDKKDTKQDIEVEVVDDVDTEQDIEVHQPSLTENMLV